MELYSAAMDTARWRQIDRVLKGALELDEGKRRAYLDEVCAADAELRAEVETMLGLEAEADPFLAEPAVASASAKLGDAWDVGRVVGAYRIEGLLGEGGMGVVYLARDEQLERLVAIKVMSETGDTRLVRRFLRETRLVSSLNHPNILTVYDAGEVEGVPYLVTEYVRGDVLRARMARGMAVGEAVDVARQVASALSTAHAAGVVHRDVKPENVMVRGDGLVKVLDFGIAKEAEGGGEKAGSVVTESGMLIGTTSYMSPEQVEGSPLDGRTDVWSLGVMLYEMVAGRLPFRGRTRWDTLVAVMSREPEPVAELPDGLGAIIGRALRKSAGERYATAGEMAAALGDLQKAMTSGDVPKRGAVTTAGRARAGAEPPTNKVGDRERLIGREAELGAIVDGLRATRLLTVTGPGGTGKTRLAREAARALLAEFEGGVYLVELAAIRDPALVASAIAQAVDVKEGAGVSLSGTLVQVFGDRELLLVLDNFEQVIDAAGLVARLLADTPGVKVLVTSRERLRLTGERELALSPLELPPAGGSAMDEGLAAYGSVALFVERARAVRSSFELATLSEAGRRAVAEICRRLDGLPLAIELAAARLRLLTPEALLGRLDQQLKLLTGGARDMPERQQTMRAAIAWSYDLLADDERRTFERLSVFSGGWTLDAAERLDPDADVLELLSQLADKSLLVIEERDGAMRYRMLETIRQFAAERLRERGEEPRSREAHAAWFVELAEEGAAEYERSGETEWIGRLDRERENVRAALEWGAGSGVAPETTLRLSAAMGPFWSLWGRWSEGRSWLERALASDPAPSPVRATALLWVGTMARHQSDYAWARERVTESLAMWRELGNRRHVVHALVELGVIVETQLELDVADALLQEALALHEGLDDDRGRAGVLKLLVRVAYDREDFDGAEAAVEKALAIFRGLDDRRRVAIELYNLGILARRRGDYERATELLEESLGLAREFDERPLVARATHFLGNVAGDRSDYAGAARLRAEAAREYLAMGDRFMLRILVGHVAGEALGRGSAERAAYLFGALMRLEETGELPQMGPGDASEVDLAASVRETLGETEAAAAMARGRRLTLGEVLKAAFEE